MFISEKIYFKAFSTLLIFSTLHQGLLCNTDNRIIGGRPADIGEVPYQVSLRKSYNDEHFCGGVLITPRHVLVAAHCVFYTWGGILPPFVISVVAGQLTLPLTKDSIYRNASFITVHPNYNSTTMGNDISVIEVNIPFPIESNPLIKTIQMANTSIEEGSCMVSGWGVEEYGSKVISPVLLITEVDIVKYKKCQDMYAPNVTLVEGMLCAGHVNGTTDACKGDSGGPLICDGLLAGIVSTGSGCGSALYPGIYTNITHYRTWIQSVLDMRLLDTNYHFDRSKIPAGSFVEYLINKTLSLKLERNDGNTRISNTVLLKCLVLICLAYAKLFISF